MPVTTVATSDVLTASHFNTNYRDQVVSTVTSSTRPSGTEGQLIYETDTNRLYVYTGSTWELVYQQGGWTSYTPTIAQGATTNIAKTVTYAKYTVMGKLVIANLILDVTGTGTSSNAFTITLPVTAASASFQAVGNCDFYDSSATTHYNATAVMFTTTTVIFIADVATNGALGAAGFTAALASGDSIRFTLMYEAA